MFVEFPDLEGGLIMRNGANVEHVVCSIRIYVNDIHGYSRRSASGIFTFLYGLAGLLCCSAMLFTDRS